MPPHRGSHAKRAIPLLKNSQGNRFLPPRSTPTSASQSSDLTLTNTHLQPTSRPPLHTRLLEWLCTIPRRHWKSCIAAFLTIALTVAFGAGAWIASSKQIAQTQVQIAQTTRQIEQADIQIKQAALSLCNTVSVFQNRSECQNLLSAADSLLNVTDSRTVNLTKRFLATIDNATTHCISEHLDMFEFLPLGLSDFKCQEYLDVAHQEKIATAACTFAGVLGWAMRMGADPWWEELERWNPDNIYWYLGPCFLSVIIVSRWGWSTHRPNLLPFQVLIAVVAFMHSGGLGAGRRRRGREKAVDDFSTLDMMLIPCILALSLGIIWAFLLSDDH